MIKNLKVYIFIISFILSIFIFVSCNAIDETPHDSTNEIESIIETPAETSLKIIENGVSNFAVIRPEKASDIVMQSVKELYNFLSDYSSEYVRIETDYTLDYLTSGIHNHDTYEIIIGNTIYEESQNVLKNIGYGEYSISVVGKKIVVAAFTDDGIVQAIGVLKNIFEEYYDESTSSLIIDISDITVYEVFDEIYNAFPNADEEEFKYTFDCGDGSVMIAFNKVSEQIFKDYINKLLDRGYSEYSSTSMGQNKFATLYSDKYIANISLTQSDKTMRIRLDDASKFVLPKHEDYDPANKVCDSLLIQVGTSPKDNESQNGMCYLIRCEDGSFIVYDGGYSKNETDGTPRNNYINIYNAIMQYTPDGVKQRISAWVFTHAHSDHAGAFVPFAKNYSEEVAIDQFIYNFPSGDPKINEHGEATANAVRNAIQEYYSDATHIKACPGQRICYSNVEMEVLYTLEFDAPNPLSYYNTCSVITRLYVNGQSILMSADMSKTANAICCEYYGRYLKSDFYQVPHHGYDGGTTAFNQYVNPTWALWPVGELHYNDGLHGNNVWIASSENVKIHFPAWFQTTVINLPFDGAETSYTVYPNSVPQEDIK